MVEVGSAARISFFDSFVSIFLLINLQRFTSAILLCWKYQESWLISRSDCNGFYFGGTSCSLPLREPFRVDFVCSPTVFLDAASALLFSGYGRHDVVTPIQVSIHLRFHEVVLAEENLANSPAFSNNFHRQIARSYLSERMIKKGSAYKRDDNRKANALKLPVDEGERKDRARLNGALSLSRSDLAVHRKTIHFR